MTPIDPEGTNALPDKKKVRAATTARSMPDAANTGNSLEGYAAVNALDENDEIACRAHDLYLERQHSGQEGTAEDDWFRAEQEVRRNRMERNVA
jgi:hypothetical protein